jgi:hypothetical protein
MLGGLGEFIWPRIRTSQEYDDEPLVTEEFSFLAECCKVFKKALALWG